MKFRYAMLCTLTAAVLASQAELSADELSMFRDLKQKYQTYLKEAGKPLHDSYQKRLLDKEKAAVARRDYGLAAKIKNERTVAAEEIGILLTDAGGIASLATLEEDGSVTMMAPDANVGGGVTLDQEKEALTGWNSASAFARWKLPVGVKTGGYDVELTYSCAGGGGTFVVKEDTYSLKRATKDSGSWASFLPEVCGTLRVKSTSQNLQISATTVTGQGGLFYLKMVRLLPTTTPLES